MSMKMLTILQFISVFAAYTFLTVLLPAMVFHSRFRKERAVVRLFLYLAIGNFFYVNLVYLLQILHISNRFTLIVGTVLGVFLAASRVYKKPPKESLHTVRTVFFKLLSGTLGYRLVLGSIWSWIKKIIQGILARLNDSIKNHFFDWVLTAVVTIVFLWMYGTKKLEIFGYTASDMPVHNYWINAMGNGINNPENNNIFVAGVYPFGFHCVIYYLHTVFKFETYVLMRIFSLVQLLFIHYVLLAFLRGCCKARYFPYGAVLVYILAAFWGTNSYLRYYSTLPQEFGMIFILPSIYFLFQFFEARKREVQNSGNFKAKKKKDKKLKAEKNTSQKFKTGKRGGQRFRKEKKQIQKLQESSMKYLIGFAMSFSLTFSAHFYDTIVAGVLCIGIAVGYAFRLFKKAYFGRVMLAGILSILIAILPLGVAFAMGTPLEGSLYWAMGVISGEKDEEPPSDNQTDIEKETPRQPQTENNGQDSEATSTDTSPSGITGGSTGDIQNTAEDASPSGQPPDKGILQKLADKAQNLKEKAVHFKNIIRTAVKSNVFSRGSDSLCNFAFVCMGIMAIFGILYLLGEDKEYGAVLLSISSGIFFMMILLASGKLGLPSLLETGRCSLYTSYLLPAAPVLALDALLCTLFDQKKKEIKRNAISLLISISWVLILTAAGKVRFPSDVPALEALESNDAIICLTNIIKENKEGTYTICSANDELRMVEDYGYFYEIINFLREMEGEDAEEILTIPTEYVYFFIEKVPIDYTVSYARSGQTISHEGASHRLPSGGGLSLYQAKNRWILMSRMYYWAQAFQKFYENEMKVYYESDTFICYQVKQNPYRLFDFSIDYGYNMMFAGNTE
ncbi:MAG: amino acid ABC transporter permease [Lachnospiraceae bacterium]|nr:amino acid ABC transporter permease [Lachnospiraceae bacterium]